VPSIFIPYVGQSHHHSSSRWLPATRTVTPPTGVGCCLFAGCCLLVQRGGSAAVVRAADIGVLPIGLLRRQRGELDRGRRWKRPAASSFYQWASTSTRGSVDARKTCSPASLDIQSACSPSSRMSCHRILPNHAEPLARERGGGGDQRRLYPCKPRPGGVCNTLCF
jgi:hypothetical protein